MTFPYIDDEPIVPLDIQTRNGEWYRFHAYIDSGAGLSVFHADYTQVLGLKLEDGKKIFLTVGDGEQIVAYVHILPVQFAGKKFTAEIAFSPNLGVGTDLMGLASFFDRFSICFNHKNRYVDIKLL